MKTESGHLSMITPSGASSLVRCLYVSRRASDAMNALQIDEILKTSRARNAENEITGGLICTGHFFFQVLEGPGFATARVMESINADPRHTNVTPLIFEKTAARQFSSWTMGFADLPSAVALIEPLFKVPDDEHANQVTAVLLRALQEGGAQQPAL